MLLALLLLAAPAAATILPKGLIVIKDRMSPPLVLANADGDKVDIARLRGQWVMVHFWASWCNPCRRELPRLQRMTGMIPSDHLRVIMVNTAETEEEVFVFLSQVAPEIDSYLDRDGQVTEHWQPRGLPSSFLVDPEGRIRYLALGGRPWDNPEYLSFLRALK